MNNFSVIKKSSPFKEWLRYHFLDKKLKTGLGYIIFGLLAVGIASGTALIDVKVGIGILGAFAVIFIVALFFRYPYFGLYFTIAFAALPPLLERLPSNIDFPYASVTDGLFYLLLLSVILKYKLRSEVDRKFFYSPLFVGLSLLFAYYIIQVLNPNMFSKLGWFSYTRKYILQLFFVLICYCLLNSWKTFKYFIYFWIVFVTILAAYACKQQWFGLAAFEWNWLNARPLQLQLFLQGGLLRKFSTLSDPATSGVLFASVAMQCIILTIREKNKKIKTWLLIASIINSFGFIYSGTRTATLMMVAGIAFYCIATIYERRTMIFAIIALLGFVALMVSPWHPPAIERVRSTFNGTKDASAAVRDINRHRVQPYLYDHPMGGGIYTCVSEGSKYNPGHYLEHFTPDSGYMKVFAEQGFIGLGILLFCYYLFLRSGIKNFYRARNLEIQNHCIALVTMVFTLMVGQYSQIALVLEPGIFYFLGALVFFIKLPNYDDINLVQAQNP